MFLTFISCNNKRDQVESLMLALDDYETAWANGDFVKVESYFTEDAKRLHTEPYVWDRQKIKEYFLERADKSNIETQSNSKKNWKADRKYIEIRIEGNIAYDIFTTDRFKALHIWEKQHDGSWKIKYDVGVLNYPEENTTTK
jgi:ketosteroid isomerase-like protein